MSINFSLYHKALMDQNMVVLRLCVCVQTTLEYLVFVVSKQLIHILLTNYIGNIRKKGLIKRVRSDTDEFWEKLNFINKSILRFHLTGFGYVVLLDERSLYNLSILKLLLINRTVLKYTLYRRVLYLFGILHVSFFNAFCNLCN